jgi:L-arabinose isomerase
VSTDGPIMTIGNTQTPVKFKKDPDSYMDEWFTEAPTHHFAMSIGHNASLFEKISDLMNISFVVLDK